MVLNLLDATKVVYRELFLIIFLSVCSLLHSTKLITSEDHLVHPLAKQGHLEHIAQDHTEAGFECLQRRRDSPAFLV